MTREMGDSIEKLSELRSKYSCFDEEEQPYYHALSLGIKGIKALEQCKDCISREAVIQAIYHNTDRLDIAQAARELPSVQPVSRWIPVKWHTITDEEREREGYPIEWVTYIDCIMPEDNQEILITVEGKNRLRWVTMDTNYIDDGFYLDSGLDWIEDVVAWMPLPQPYKAESEG